MEEIRTECENYEARDVYNTDETGYFRRACPKRSLATATSSGTKQGKERISVLLTCNADGSDKLPLWFIGKYKQPRCFRRERLQGLCTLGAHWRHNKKAWMNTEIFKEFLRDFDNRFHGRKVLLLMDNFSAHMRAYEELQEEKQLRNTKVIW
jgi:hypothetical protein